MAPKKSSSSSKKGGGKGGPKGPKGKKARAKAKLDRQWGEQPRQEQQPSSSIKDAANDPSLGTSRRQQRHHHHHPSSSKGPLGPRPATSTSASSPALDSSSFTDRREDPLYHRRRRFAEEDSDDSDSFVEASVDGVDDEEAPAATRLLQSLRDHQREAKKRRKRDRRAFDSESSRESSDDGDGPDDKSATSSKDQEGDNSDSNVNRDTDAKQQVDQSEAEPNEANQWVVEDDFFQDRFVTRTEPVTDTAIHTRSDANETIPLGTDPGLVMQVSSCLLDRLKLIRAVAVSSPKNADVPTVQSQLQSLTRSLLDDQLSPPLRASWNRYCQSTGGAGRNMGGGRRGRHDDALPDPLLYPFVSAYADVLVAEDNGTSSRDSRLAAVAIHILNHVHKTQQVIRRNNHALYHKPTSSEDKHDDDDDDEMVDPPRDQGFTRPTVLVLLPTRSCCYQLVQLLQSLLAGGGGSPQSNAAAPTADPTMERFEAEYGPPSSSGAEGDGNAPDEAAAQRRRRQILRQKGSDWLELFGDEANDDDDFKLGIALHKSRSSHKGSDESCLKLFADFYKSDIILASPLGLKILIENKDGTNDGDDDDNNSDDEQDTSKSKSQRGYDFLSSIEICYVSRADVLLMQNWDHVCDVVRLLNEQPKCSTAIDFSRVRPYHLVAGQSQYWRQLIVTSSFVDPMILSLFKLHAKSSAGAVRLRRKTLDVADAAIARVVLPTRQVFQRVPTQSLADHASDRVRYFCDAVLPEVVRQRQGHTLVFIPSYFDFVSIRNVMLKREIDFVSVTEYSRVSEVSRGRARFLQGRKPIMLYTGRAHFFHRHAIRGARHMIFVGVPEYADFYSGLVNMLGDGLDHQKNEATSTVEASSLVLLTKYDGHALERIVGLQNCSRMLRGDKSTFLF